MYNCTMRNQWSGHKARLGRHCVSRWHPRPRSRPRQGRRHRVHRRRRLRRCWKGALAAPWPPRRWPPPPPRPRACASSRLPAPPPLPHSARFAPSTRARQTPTPRHVKGPCMGKFGGYAARESDAGEAALALAGPGRRYPCSPRHRTKPSTHERGSKTQSKRALSAYPDRCCSLRHIQRDEGPKRA